MNPCPCGYAGDPKHTCRCSPARVATYATKVSGPLLDRIDLRIQVPRPSDTELANPQPGEPSAQVRERVVAARARQMNRQGQLNAALSPTRTERICQLRAQDRRFLISAITRLGESQRACHQLLRVARTLADMAGNDDLNRKDLLEALSLRRLGEARR